MRVIVCGASGFIGTAVVRELAGRGHEVTGVTRDNASASLLEAAGGKVVVSDLMTEGPWVDAVRSSDVVLSLVSSLSFGEKVAVNEAHRRSYQQGKMVGNLFMAAQGSKAKGVILSYGALGYGDRGDQWVTEYTDLNPTGFERAITGAYWHIEKTSRKARLPLLNLFTGWTYGPGGWFDAMVRGLRNGSWRVVGDGDNYMSLIHVDDLATAYANIVEKAPFGQRYCLVDGHPVTQRELTGFVAERLGCRPPASIDPANYARTAGELAAESFTASVKVSYERMKASVLPELKFPSYREGVPQALEAMGVTQDIERAA